MARATHISKHDNVVNLERRETYAPDDIVVNSYFSQFNGPGASHDDDQNKRTGSVQDSPCAFPSPQRALLQRALRDTLSRWSKARDCVRAHTMIRGRLAAIRAARPTRIELLRTRWQHIVQRSSRCDLGVFLCYRDGHDADVFIVRELQRLRTRG